MIHYMHISQAVMLFKQNINVHVRDKSLRLQLFILQETIP